jgi:hypothetical protein
VRTILSPFPWFVNWRKIVITFIEKLSSPDAPLARTRSPIREGVGIFPASIAIPVNADRGSQPYIGGQLLHRGRIPGTGTPSLWSLKGARPPGWQDP